MNLHGKEIKIFSGSANPDLARQIAENLGLPLGKCKVSTFSDGEISISLEESVRGSDCFIIQSTCQPVNSHLMEILILADAMRRASAVRTMPIWAPSTPVSRTSGTRISPLIR